jgi:hypothetical protein
LIRNSAVVVPEELPRDAAIEIGDSETRIETNRPVEIVDRAAVVVHSLKGHAAIDVGGWIVREEPNHLAEVGCGLAELARSQTMTSDAGINYCLHPFHHVASLNRSNQMPGNCSGSIPASSPAGRLSLSFMPWMICPPSALAKQVLPSQSLPFSFVLIHQ